MRAHPACVLVPIIALLLGSVPALADDGPSCCRAVLSAGGEPVALSGTVASVQELGCPGKMARRQLRLETGEGEIEVLLGPVHYLDRQDLRVARGDAVEITGVRTEDDGKPIVVAERLTRGDATLSLRDGAGRPAWAGEGMGMNRRGGGRCGHGPGCGGCCGHGRGRG